MRRILLTAFLMVVLTAGVGYAHMGGMMGPSMMGGSQGQGYQQQQDNPYMVGYGMGYGMGPGMMGGYGMGPGMMGGMCPMMGMMGGYGMGPGMMGGYGMGPGRWGYTTEAYQKFLDETAGLRKELQNRQFDYHEAIRNSKTTPETITKLEKEIYELQRKIYEKAPR